MQKKYPTPESLIIYYLESGSAGGNYILDKLCQWQRVEVACAFMAQDPDDYQWMREQDWLNEALLSNYLGDKEVDIKETVENLITAYYEDKIDMLFNQLSEDYETKLDDLRTKKERDPEWQHGAER